VDAAYSDHKKLFDLYLKDLQNMFNQREYTEMSYRTFLHTFIENLGRVHNVNWNLTQESQMEDGIIGRPDFKAYRGNTSIGYIETKGILSNLDEVLKTDQLRNYLSSINNLILTNYCRFLLFRDGQKILDIQLVQEYELRKTAYAGIRKLPEFMRLLDDFFSYRFPQIRSASVLAHELAKKSRLLKDLAKVQLTRDQLAYDVGKETSNVFEFLQIMRELIFEISIDNCSDNYAQTITYGLFLGRYYQTKAKDYVLGTPITRVNAYNFIPKNIGLIRKIILNIVSDLPDDMNWIVEEICEVLNGADIKTSLSEVSSRTGQSKHSPKDSFLLFYEDFLREYDPKKRKEHGVYYTPRQIVSFIVKSVEKILKNDFQIQDGFADNTVTALDPSIGTGSFLNLLYVRAILELITKKRAGEKIEFIKRHVLGHFYGFELLIPPYILAHLKLSQQLSSWGYDLSEEDRIQVFLTNTLEDPHSHKHERLDAFVREIGQENKKANEIKNKEILVVLGNPPYNKHAYNRSEWILNLTADYKHGLNERRLGNLNDDYVNFFRFAQWKVQQNPNGVLAFITNNSFIDNTTFRGMRKSLLETFNEIYILNLHGDSNLNNPSPNGENDENVFDIKQGVCISILIRKEGDETHKVFYSDYWGDKNKKLKYIDSNNIKTINWTELHPNGDYYLFVPSELNQISEYNSFYPITQIFDVYNSGLETKRDNFIVSYTREELQEKMSIFSNPLIDYRTIESQFGLEDIVIGKDKKGKLKYEWKLIECKQEFEKSGYDNNSIVKYSYRPFDQRWIYFSPKLISRPRNPESDLIISNNISLCVSRLTKAPIFSSALVSDSLVDLKFSEYSRGVYFFPLLRNKDSLSSELSLKSLNLNDKSVNFSDDFKKFIISYYQPKQMANEVFNYIYAILQSKIYREKYNDYLRIDFPKVYFTKNLEVFKKLSNLGEKLVDLHLEKTHPTFDLEFNVEGTNEVEKIEYEEGKLFINELQYFSPVPLEVWNYRIGNYEVLKKYLKGRKGRKLNMMEIRQVARISGIIKETIKTVSEIDDLLSLELENA
jgi:type I restriction-modification system DNA methylase subunit